MAGAEYQENPFTATYMRDSEEAQRRLNSEDITAEREHVENAISNVLSAWPTDALIDLHAELARHVGGEADYKPMHGNVQVVLFHPMFELRDRIDHRRAELQAVEALKAKARDAEAKREQVEGQPDAPTKPVPKLIAELPAKIAKLEDEYDRRRAAGESDQSLENLSYSLTASKVLLGIWSQ